MIQEEIKVEKQEVKAFPPLPSDIYQCEILDINLGQRPTYDTRNLPDDQKKYEKVFKFQFTVLDHADLRGRNVWNNFVPSSLRVSSKTGKNELYKILEAVLGHELTQEEEATIDKNFINSLIGRQLRVFVVTVKKGDKTYDKADRYLPVISLLPALTSEEKENARVKVKEEPKATVNEGDAEYIDPDKITF